MSRPGRRTRGRVAVVAVAAALSLSSLLAGCGSTQAGAAAVIGARRITVNDVQTATEQIRHVQGAENASQQQVLLLLIAEPYAVDAASKASVAVSVQDARDALKGSVDDPQQPTVDLMRANLALNRLNQSQNGQAEIGRVLDQVAAASPRINPRYGRFDPQQKTIVPLTPGWIAPSPSPGASSGGESQPSPSPSG